jgi:hypothetical protein
MMKDKSAQLVEELLSHFRSERHTIIGAKGVAGYRPPDELRNDGYGDQKNKSPDVFAFDETNKRYVIGVVKTSDDDLESPHSLTQYDVFFDHKNAQNGKSSQVCFILQPETIAEFTAIITHYIHPDYWNNMMIIRSKKIE